MKPASTNRVVFGDCRRFEPNGHDWKFILIGEELGWRCGFCGEAVVIEDGGGLLWLFTVEEEP